MQPLLQKELVLSRREGQRAGVVVCFDEVLDDGARLPERDARVGVFDGREAAVWVDGEVGFFLYDGEVDDDLG